MNLLPAMVNAGGVADAWVKATSLVYNQTHHHGYHLVVAIECPTIDNERVHRLVDRLMKQVGIRSDIDTIANTIFPVGLSKGCKRYSELRLRFLSMYPRIRKFAGNARGTYFGRMVALPNEGGDIDQLGPIIRRLRGKASNRRRKKKTPYQMELIGNELKVYEASKDINIELGFPCLSFCAFQRDVDSLHLTAHYRNHHMVERAYGNYLGLGRLLAFVSHQAHLKPGRLIVISGHAEIESSPAAVRETLDEAAALLE